MTTIDTSQRLAVVLRREVGAFRRVASGPAAAARGRSGVEDVAGVVARRIHGVAADDPRRRDKAVRIFLESVFLQELGPALVHDPAFDAMVDAVHGRMRDDAELAAALDGLATVLLQSGRDSRPR